MLLWHQVHEVAIISIFPDEETFLKPLPFLISVIFFPTAVWPPQRRYWSLVSWSLFLWPQGILLFSLLSLAIGLSEKWVCSPLSSLSLPLSFSPSLFHSLCVGVCDFDSITKTPLHLKKILMSDKKMGKKREGGGRERRENLRDLENTPHTEGI